MIPMRGAGRDQQMTDAEMCDAAEANIRADYRDGVIDKQRFQMEMLIVARSRSQSKAEPKP